LVAETGDFTTAPEANLFCPSVDECIGTLRQWFAGTMSFMWRTAGYAGALVGLTVIAAAPAQEGRAAFAKFKNEMMPKVGQKITVVGTIDVGKQGFWLAFNHWGAYIYVYNESSAKIDDLYAHRGQTVKVTGTLRHFEPVGTGKDKHGRTVQVPPEHFFFYAAEVEMSFDLQSH
jgi:hypothetical protein